MEDAGADPLDRKKILVRMIKEEFKPGMRVRLLRMNDLDSIGRRKIAFLNGPSEYKYARHRRMGFESGLQKCGIIFNPKLVISVSNIIPDLAFSAAMQLIKSGYPIDAFFTPSDVFAMAVIRAVKYSGLRVPQDIAVLGCDNISLSGYFTPSITTISQPCLQLGATSMELLVDRISNPDGFIQKIVLEPELIIREST